MKRVIIVLSLLLTITANAQEIVEQKDKFQNLSSLSLKDMIDLDVGSSTTTSDFEINIFKITKEDEVVYAFYVITESDYLIKCEEDNKCIFLYNDSMTIDLYSTFSDFEIRKNSLTTVFQIPVHEDELMLLKEAKKIEVKIYCKGGTFHGKFRKDDLKEFKNGIKLLSER